LKRMFDIGLLAVLTVVLTACGASTSETDPTPVPTAAPIATVSAGGTMVGTLLDRMEAGWTTVQSSRSTFWTTDNEIGVAPPPTGEVTLETTTASNRRHVVRTVNGEVVEEQMMVDGRVFMRGQIVVAAIAPMVGTEQWVEVDPRAASTTNALAAQIDWLLSPIGFPFANVSEETRGQEAFPGDDVSIGGRACQTWTFGDPDGIVQELAIDAQNLPCRLVQQAAGVANVTIYDINPADAAIEIPTLATPTSP
jgi:hypothetical protein